jgi:hypothetical protein
MATPASNKPVMQMAMLITFGFSQRVLRTDNRNGRMKQNNAMCRD